MKKLLFICLSVFLLSEYVIGQTKQLSGLDYYNKAVRCFADGDITNGQINMDMAFNKGFMSLPLLITLTGQNFNNGFENGISGFYIALSMCNNLLFHFSNELTYSEKESVYAMRGISKLNIAHSKGIRNALEYADCIDDLEKGGEYGKAVIQEYKEKTQKQQKKQKAPQGKRLKKDPNFKIE